MISHFLRLFPAHRDLEAQLLRAARNEQVVREQHARELQVENDAKVAAVERVRDLEADNMQLREDLKAAQDARVTATETVADWLAQMQFGRKIFGHAPALPEHSVEPQAIPRQRSQARQAVDEGTRAFYESLASQAN